MISSPVGDMLPSRAPGGRRITFRGLSPLGSCGAGPITRPSWEVVRSGEVAGRESDEATERIGTLLPADR